MRSDSIRAVSVFGPFLHHNRELNPPVWETIFNIIGARMRSLAASCLLNDVNTGLEPCSFSACWFWYLNIGQINTEACRYLEWQRGQRTFRS